MAGCEGHLGGNARHNDSDSRLGGGGGAGAGVEAEGDDEESAGGCADYGEDASPFKAAEETAPTTAPTAVAMAAMRYLTPMPKTRHQDGQDAGQDADEHAYDRHCCGDPQHFYRAAQDEGQ